MKILSIDFGLKRVGLAEADTEVRIAFALDPIVLNGKTNLIPKIKEIVSDKNIELILVGIPLGFDQKETQMSKKVLKFIEDLGCEIPDIKIKALNETLTSKQASANLRLGKSKRSIDSESARIILQEYLDHHFY